MQVHKGDIRLARAEQIQQTWEEGAFIQIPVKEALMGF